MSTLIGITTLLEPFTPFNVTLTVCALRVEHKANPQCSTRAKFSARLNG